MGFQEPFRPKLPAPFGAYLDVCYYVIIVVVTITAIIASSSVSPLLPLNSFLKPKSEHVTPLKILLSIKDWASWGPVSSWTPLPQSPSLRSSLTSCPVPATWHMLPCIGVPDLANNLQYSRHAHTNKLFSLSEIPTHLRILSVPQSSLSPSASLRSHVTFWRRPSLVSLCQLPCSRFCPSSSLTLL